MNLSKLYVGYTYIYGEGCVIKTPHHFVNRCYPFAVVVFVERGTYHARINDLNYDVHAGEALVVPEFTLHDVWMTEEGMLSWAHINARVFGRDILSFFRLPLIFYGNDAQALGRCARELSSLSGLDQSTNLLPVKGDLDALEPLPSESDVYSKVNIAPQIDTDMLPLFRKKTAYDSLIAKMFHLILNCAEGSSNLDDQSYTWLSEVSEYVHQHIREQITLQQLSSTFNMSERTFSKKFRQYFPQPPIDYVISEKIRYATWLLLNGMNVKSVALELGFTDSYYFTRQFKKRMGCSPSQYTSEYFRQNKHA